MVRWTSRSGTVNMNGSSGMKKEKSDLLIGSCNDKYVEKVQQGQNYNQKQSLNIPLNFGGGNGETQKDI